MELYNYKIYKLIDPRDNQIRYIGETFQTLKKRLKGHCGASGKSYVVNWVRKLKSLNLKPIIELIEDSIGTYEEVCNREIYWIDLHWKMGYKLTNSASGGNKNKKMSDETKRKMSIAQLNSSYKLIMSDESKRRCSESRKKYYKDNPEYKIIQSKIGKEIQNKKTEQDIINDILKQNCKSVSQYDMNLNFINKYISIKDAERKTGICCTNISKTCQKKVNSAGGYIWIYDGDKLPDNIKLYSKSVIQYDICGNYINKFTSIGKAAKNTNSRPQGIISCCKGKYTQSNGFIWKYETNI